MVRRVWGIIVDELILVMLLERPIRYPSGIVKF